jgi:hypothetical protein
VYFIDYDIYDTLSRSDHYSDWSFANAPRAFRQCRVQQAFYGGLLKPIFLVEGADNIVDENSHLRVL